MPGGRVSHPFIMQKVLAASHPSLLPFAQKECLRRGRRSWWTWPSWSLLYIATTKEDLGHLDIYNLSKVVEHFMWKITTSADKDISHQIIRNAIYDSWYLSEIIPGRTSDRDISTAPPLRGCVDLWVMVAACSAQNRCPSRAAQRVHCHSPERCIAS